jgi:hypothetical protein
MIVSRQTPWVPRESEARRNADELCRKSQLRATPVSTEGVPDSATADLGEGQPLGPAERSLFEARFGRDFSQVRVHADAEAAELADEASARAFTTGPHIVFGANERKPAPRRSALMAHERPRGTAGG